MMYILVLNFFMVSNMYDQCSHCFQMYHVNINTSYETVHCAYLSDRRPRVGWAEVSFAAYNDVDLFVKSFLPLVVCPLHPQEECPSLPSCLSYKHSSERGLCFLGAVSHTSLLKP